MAGTPTDWEWSAEAPAYQVDWTDADSLRLTDVEYLLKAIMECLREKCIASDTPVPALISDPYSPITSIKTYTDMIQSTVTALLPEFVNHISSGGNYEGLTAIPHWTEAGILSQIGDPSRLVLNRLNDLPDWCIQQYKILNMLRYYVTGRAGTTLLNYRYADATDADLATAIANAKNNLLAASWGHSGPVGGQTGTWAFYYDNVGTYNVQLYQGRYYFEYNNTTPFDILFHLYGYVWSGGANYFDPIGTAPAENKWYVLDYSQTIPAYTDWDYGYFDGWTLDNVPTPSSFPYTAAGMVDDEYSLGYKYLLKFTGANGFKFRDWVPETIPI